MRDLTDRHPSTQQIARYFDWGHLLGHLQALSAPCELLAEAMIQALPDGPELTTGLRKITVGSLCTGYGGLELALDVAGIGHELAWWSETDPYAAAVMAAHTTAPNLGDLCDLTDPPRVDIITAGFPCQPVSHAGRRAGVDDERWLIDAVCRAASAAGAGTLILENVAAILTANDGDAMAHVCAALAETGFSRWEWTTLRASDVGAPHQRDRWFCVAHSADSDSARWPGLWREGIEGLGRGPVLGGCTAPDTDGWQPQRRRDGDDLGGAAPTEPGQGDQRQRAGHTAGHRYPAPADTNSGGCELQWVSGLRRDGDPLTGPDADRCPRERTWGAYAPAIGRWERILGRSAPAPTIDGRLNPLLVEWMMGLLAGWVTDCGLSRTQQLRVLGNGVVPQQAAAAITALTRRVRLSHWIQRPQQVWRVDRSTPRHPYD